MARPRSAGFEGQRDQILAAAAEVFATRGYAVATMQDVAAACGISKATLYHYVRDKPGLLAQIMTAHVARLETLVSEVTALGLAPQPHLRELILHFMRAYAGAQHAHRVLTESLRFLPAEEQAGVRRGQRRVLAAFAQAVAASRPDLAGAGLQQPLAMLLFGMINWTFTWLRQDGPLTHETLAPLVVDLFLGGLPAVTAA